MIFKTFLLYIAAISCIVAPRDPLILVQNFETHPVLALFGDYPPFPKRAIDMTVIRMVSNLQLGKGVYADPDMLQIPMPARYFKIERRVGCEGGIWISLDFCGFPLITVAGKLSRWSEYIAMKLMSELAYKLTHCIYVYKYYYEKYYRSYLKIS